MATDVPSTEEYGQMLGDLMTYGAVSLSLAMAQETGMVHVLCTADQPLTSLDIAQRANLKERYVREVLGALTSARFVQLDPTDTSRGFDCTDYRYTVPEQHRSALKETAVLSMAVSACARHFEKVKECFEVNKPSCVRYGDVLIDIMGAIGRDGNDMWLNISVDSSGLKDKLKSGLKVAEVGSGSGWLTQKMAETFPNSRFACTDGVASAVQCAKERIQNEAAITNITFDVLDVCDIPDEWSGKFDWIISQNVIHDMPHPQKAVEGIYKSLKPGGTFTMIDECVSSYLPNNVGKKDAMMLFSFSTFLCIPESYQQPDSEALGACWGEERANAIAKAAGFEVLKVEKFQRIGTQAVWTCRKPN